MKKLKLSLQNIEGSEVLSREQLKKVIGGDESGGSANTYFCWITTYGPNYSNPETTGSFYGGSQCSDASSGANTSCVNLIATPGNGVHHCSYDCGC